MKKMSPLFFFFPWMSLTLKSFPKHQKHDFWQTVRRAWGWQPSLSFFLLDLRVLITKEGEDKGHRNILKFLPQSNKVSIIRRFWSIKGSVGSKGVICVCWYEQLAVVDGGSGLKIIFPRYGWVFCCFFLICGLKKNIKHRMQYYGNSKATTLLCQSRQRHPDFGPSSPAEQMARRDGTGCDTFIMSDIYRGSSIFA